MAEVAAARATGTALRVFVPFAAGYFLSYVYRSVNAVIAPDLTETLGLEPAVLGLLTSAYFAAFAAFQLPLGVLLDRFGPRRVESALLLVAALGALVFSAGDSTRTLVAGRALIGLGVSACLMASFTAFRLSFRSERLPLANGCIMAAGGLGAVTATAPVEALLQVTDWRGLFRILALATLGAAALIFVVVPRGEAGRAGPREGLGAQLRGVRTVFASPLFWRVAPLTAFTQASFLAVQGLWSGPWLKDVRGLERAEVAAHLLGIALCMIVGYLAGGALAVRLARRGVRLAVFVGTGTGAFMLVQLAIVLDLGVPSMLLWGLFGCLGTTAVLCYAVLAQRFPRALTGRVITGLNVLVFATAFLAQWGLGAVIGQWPADPAGAYPAGAYSAAFALALGLQGMALVWFTLPRRGTRL